MGTAICGRKGTLRMTIIQKGEPMSDLIDRQAAIDALCDNCETVNSSCAHYPCKRYLAIQQLPSAQPEIIYCKDCEWSDWYTAIDGHRYCYCMETGNGGRTEDDFCSYAEMQEECQ
jgi:hypothetical protein